MQFKFPVLPPDWSGAEQGQEIHGKAEDPERRAKQMPARHRMSLDQDIPPAHRPNAIDAEKGVTQVIEDAEKQNEIELAEFLGRQPVDRSLNVFYARPQQLLQPVESCHVGILETVGNDLACTAPLALEAEAAVPRTDV